MKKHNILIIVLIFISLIFVQAANVSPWCWTAPSVSEVDKEDGGENWGICAVGMAKSSRHKHPANAEGGADPGEQSGGETSMDKAKKAVAKSLDPKTPLNQNNLPQDADNPDPDPNSGPGPKKINYRFITEIPQIQGCGAKGNFFFKVEGTKGSTDEFMVTDQGFQDGETDIYNVRLDNVGDVTKLFFRNDGYDNLQCKHVTVEIGFVYWVFDCDELGFSCPERCTYEMDLAGTYQYEYTVRTDSDKEAGTESPIYVQLLGTTGKTDIKLLSDTGFQRDSSVEIDHRGKDIGQVYGIILTETIRDPWSCKDIKVDYKGQFEKWECNGHKIACPNECSVTFENKSLLEQQKGDRNVPLIIMDPKEGQFDNVGVPHAVIEDFHGHTLNNIELDEMLKLTCDEVVEANEKFGPAFAGKPNYDYFIALCPTNCHLSGNSKIYGLNVHPQESGVCKSALVDNSMPLTGGVIGIVTGLGLKRYPGYDSRFGMEIVEWKTSLKSFHTFKIDNVSFAQKDIRIMDDLGFISFQGRVEFRVNGKWGSVCKRKISASAVKMICVTLGFLDGITKNPADDNEKGYCETHLKKNYCGPDYDPVLYEHMNCDNIPNVESIFQCSKQMANDCSHQQDLIVECSAVDWNIRQEPPIGGLRIVDDLDVPTSTSSGRLQYYTNHAWGSVCNTQFVDKSAQVACRQMGFLTGKLIGNEEESDTCLTYMNKDYCGKETEQISVQGVKCQGFEKHITECGQVLETQDCNHNQDIIIECKGGDGDSSGVVEQLNNQPQRKVPKLGKLPIVPIIDLTCETTLNEQIFRGDPGSIFLGNCPPDCVAAAGTVWGTMVYHGDSSICRAAIHTGAINNPGGVVEIIIKWYVEKFYGTENKGVITNEYDAPCYRSFAVSQPNTIAIQLAIDFEERDKEDDLQTNPTFIQINSQMTPKFSSFLQSKQDEFETAKPIPTFQWVKPENFAFKGKDQDLSTIHTPEAVAVGPLNTFTILGEIEMEVFTGKSVTIVSHSACGCWAIRVDTEGQLLFESRCKTPIFYAQFTMPIKQEVYFAIVFDGQYVVFYIDGSETNRHKAEYDFHCGDGIDIGWYKLGRTEFFYGQINYIEVYDEWLTQEQIAVRKDQGQPKNLPQIDIQDEQPLPIDGGVIMTTDGRTCVGKVNNHVLGICTTNITPGKPGADPPPVGAQLGQPKYPEELTRYNRFKQIIQKNMPPRFKAGINNNSTLSYEKIKINLMNKLKDKVLEQEKILGQSQQDLAQSKVELEKIQDKVKNSYKHLHDVLISKGNKSPNFASVRKEHQLLKKQLVLANMLVKKRKISYKQQLQKEKIIEFAESQAQKDTVESDAYADFVDMDIMEAQQTGMIVPRDTVQKARFASLMETAKLLLKDVDQGEDNLEDIITEKLNQLDTKMIECNTKGDDEIFNGVTGQTFTINCPSNCLDREGKVWGTMIYDIQSNVCLSAIHSGFLLKTGGTATIKLANGEQQYVSLDQNEVQSLEKGSGAKSFTFDGVPKVINIECETSLDAPQFQGKPGTLYQLMCPEKCQKSEIKVFGTDIYSSDSSICQSSMHYGTLSSGGGVVKVVVIGGNKNFISTKKNGITSQQRGPVERAFKIVGNMNDACKFFTEKYTPTNIFINWEQQDHPKSKSGPSDWTYIQNPTDKGLAFTQTVPILGSDDHYGTILINKGFDCTDVHMTANVYFGEFGTAAVVFRFQDENNYYAVEFDTEKDKIYLIKRIYGEKSILKTYDLELETQTWYKLDITYYSTNIEVFMKTGQYHEVKKIFEYDDQNNAFERGAVGIATNGEQQVFFDGLSVQHFAPEQGIIRPKQTKRSYDKCLNNASPQNRQQFCKKKYDQLTDLIDKCTGLYNYCTDCCNDLIPVNEKILNYDCQRGCVKSEKDRLADKNDDAIIEELQDQLAEEEEEEEEEEEKEEEEKEEEEKEEEDDYSEEEEQENSDAVFDDDDSDD